MPSRQRPLVTLQQVNVHTGTFLSFKYLYDFTFEKYNFLPEFNTPIVT